MDILAALLHLGLAAPELGRAFLFQVLAVVLESLSLLHFRGVMGLFALLDHLFALAHILGALPFFVNTRPLFPPPPPDVSLSLADFLDRGGLSP
jgi:hypothetical protein